MGKHDPASRKAAAEAIGKRLLKRRKQLKLRQSAVARLCGWEATRLWKYEAGITLPSPEALQCLARVLMMSAQELLALRNSNGNGGEL